MKRGIFLTFTVFFLAAVFFMLVKEYLYIQRNTETSIPDYSNYNRTLPEQTLLPNQLNPYSKLPYKELIIPLGQLVSPHTPCIVELPDGELFVAWSRTTPWGSRRILCSSRLPVGTRRWTKPSIIQDAFKGDHKNPVLYLGQDNKLRLLWTVQQNPSKWNHQDIIKVRVSDDFGHTWEDGHDIGTPAGYLSRAHPIRLHNGWLALPIYMDQSASSAISISKDAGTTWEKPKWILPFLGIEPTIIQGSDLNLFALMRSGMWPRRSWQVISKDLGRSWKNHRISDINNPGSALEMLKLRNGHVVLVFNNSKKNRYNLSIALSYDDGKTWTHIKTIENQAGHVYAYPSVIQDRYGLIHVVYAYDNHQNIAHFVTNEQWVES